MALGRNSRAAEAFWVMDVRDLRDTTAAQVRQSIGGSIPVTIERAWPAVSVIVRTKDRLHLLREAIASIRTSSYPSTIVVVNASARSIRDDLGDAEATLVEHGRDLPRSVAMNEGAAAAPASHLAFLDDDDLFYRDHLATLAEAAADGRSDGVYTDAISVAFERWSGGYRECSRIRRYARDFDRMLLLFDNYIPLTTLLVRRGDFMEAGGFDPSFDVFEDWDFLLRLTRQRSLRRIPRLTCEIRHFPSSGSAVLAMTAEDFRLAKLAIWERHRPLADPSVLVGVLESYKRNIAELQQQIMVRERQDAELSIDLVRARRMMDETAQGLAQFKTAIGYELALHPRRRTRIQKLVDGYSDGLERAARELFNFPRMTLPFTGESPAAPENGDAARIELDDLRKQLEQTRAELRKIHESQLWRVGSLYWRFLHAIGLLRIGGRREEGGS